MSDYEAPSHHNYEVDKRALNKRLESIGWGLFLIMLGATGLVPREVVPQGVWSIGVGVILLGLNVARYSYGIRMSGFTVALGILALLTGIAELFGVDLPIFAILLIIVGASMFLYPWFEEKQIFESKKD